MGTLSKGRPRSAGLPQPNFRDSSRLSAHPSKTFSVPVPGRVARREYCPHTTSAAVHAARSRNSSRAVGCRRSSASRKAIHLPSAASKPVLRAWERPWLDCAITRKRASPAAVRARMPGVSSVEPSSTQMQSQSAKVWSRREASVASRWVAPLNTGTMTVIALNRPRFLQRRNNR